MHASKGFINALENGREVLGSVEVNFENESEIFYENSLRVLLLMRPKRSILIKFREEFNEYREFSHLQILYGA